MKAVIHFDGGCEPNPGSKYDCTTCGKEELFETRAAFIEHLQKVHGVTKMSGSKKMVLHLDTATHFISSYECEIAGIKFFLSTNTERESAWRHRRLKAERTAKQ